MCRNIKKLHNFAPPATRDEVHASALQFVRKIAGTTKPSQANQPAFDRAVTAVGAAVQELLDSMTAASPPHDRALEAAKARARSLRRFGTTQPAFGTNALAHQHTHLPA
jgi:hypothetical protein